MSEKFRKVGTVDYKKGIVPDDYKCDNCGAHRVKLWREYQTIASVTKLLCADCSEKDQKKNHDVSWRSLFSRGEGDQIGWLIPAVPIEGKDTYWGYTCVPNEGVNWWKDLPTRN